MRIRRAAALAGFAAAAAVMALAPGCADPYTMYQTSGARVETGQKIMIMPFMDTRTFLAKNDPHREDVGLYVRDIFTDVLRGHEGVEGSEITSPDMAQPTQSMSTAEVAEIGRQYGADVVVAGQVFSFNNVRAASIPPRAGMFVRVISAKTGALLFVGDHYSAASVPLGAGNRDDQAHLVAGRLVEGFLAQSGNRLAGALRVASGTALANLSSAGGRDSGKSAPNGGGSDGGGDAFPGLIGALDGPADWGDDFIPEAPPILDGEAAPEKTEEAAPEAPAEQPAPAETAEEEESPESLPPPAGPESGTATEAGPEPVAEAAVESVPEPEEAPVGSAASGPVVLVQSPIVPMRPTEVDELPELGVEAVDATLASIDAQAAVSERIASLSGDDLAEDLWEAKGDVFGDGTPAAAPEQETATAAAVTEASAGPESAPLPGPVSPELVRARESGPGREAEVAAAVRANDEGNGPVISEPMVFEQPRTYRMVDLDEDPAAASQDEDALVAKPASGGNDGAPRVLILPYHDRPNPNNLIASTGGGEVVTTLFGTQLALDPGIALMWDGTGLATHDRLLTGAEAVELGRLAGADYVMRGQVVEFRRAQSVPSLYSAVISTALLAAQVFFAEMSGVDVATEVYRVSDGMCVMSRRDRAQQKYVVQAEKTVRRLAAGMVESVSGAIRAAEPEEMDPLIDGLEPVTVLSNPK